jgi:hypothetical protein
LISNKEEVIQGRQITNIICGDEKGDAEMYEENSSVAIVWKRQTTNFNLSKPATLIF